MYVNILNNVGDTIGKTKADMKDLLGRVPRKRGKRGLMSNNDKTKITVIDRTGSLPQTNYPKMRECTYLYTWVLLSKKKIW